MIWIIFGNPKWTPQSKIALPNKILRRLLASTPFARPAHLLTTRGQRAPRFPLNYHNFPVFLIGFRLTFNGLELVNSGGDWRSPLSSKIRGCEFHSSFQDIQEWIKSKRHYRQQQGVVGKLSEVVQQLNKKNKKIQIMLAQRTKHHYKNDKNTKKKKKKWIREKKNELSKSQCGTKD